MSITHMTSNQSKEHIQFGKLSENSILKWSRDIVEQLEENFKNDKALSLILDRYIFARFSHSQNQVYRSLQSEHVSHLELHFRVA